MFIVLRKKIIKRYLVLAITMILAGRILTITPTAQAAPVNEIPQVITAEELRTEGFSNNELKSMGFMNGIGKVIVYNARQKQIWEARVEKARERLEVAKRSGKKPNPRDQYLVERDNEIKNPPKKPMSEKLFGQFGLQVMNYFKKGNPPDAKIITGEGLTIGGLLVLFKTLVPFVI